MHKNLMLRTLSVVLALVMCLTAVPFTASADETEKVKVLLQSGDPVFVSLAPSFIANYEGVGITPDVEVELDESMANVNIYKIADADDNQLQRAIQEFK